MSFTACSSLKSNKLSDNVFFNQCSFSSLPLVRAARGLDAAMVRYIMQKRPYKEVYEQEKAFRFLLIYRISERRSPFQIYYFNNLHTFHNDGFPHLKLVFVNYTRTTTFPLTFLRNSLWCSRGVDAHVLHGRLSFLKVERGCRIHLSLCGLRLHGREKQHLLDVPLVGEEHGEAVDTQPPAGGGGKAVLQCHAEVFVATLCIQ